ncbi:sensor domain-containing diguanylate cyclase [Kineococcus indalonis]|uniref:sensor domain-containing diguanylate cyclase n=1 Tax=Kineococcus indalonis TaxID=2696566 RepID=UPI0014133D64|nr:diguanylate cyclase [Kineococcus indalonis]NAZ86521.1 diguanylate cyclase [Kineococcus indalonis]
MDPVAEAQREAAVHRYGLLGDGRGGAGAGLAEVDEVDEVDEQIDAVVRVAAAVAGVRSAAVNLIDARSQCTVSATGGPTGRIPRSQSLCATHFTAGEAVHVPDARREARYADNPWVDGRHGSVRSYTSIPLVSPDGHALGTLCALDAEPRELSDEQLARLGDLAGVVVALFERRRQAVLNARLAVEAEQQRALAQSLVEREQRRAEQLAALARATRAVATAEDPRTAVCAAARELAGADAAYLLQPGTGPDGRGRLLSTASVGLAAGTRLRLDLDGGRALPLSAFRSARPLFVADVAGHPDADPALVESSGTVSGLWQPVLLRDGSCTGVLGVVWRHRLEELEATPAAMLHTLAGQAAHALERTELLTRLQHASERDPLTGVGNRRHWNRVAAREVEAAESAGRPVTFALIDLDHFKAYNDAYGHLAGDDLLREFAAAATAQLREEDTLARWGGEEFALALPGRTLSQARTVAERIRAAVPHAQTATVGLAQWLPGTSAATVLARADAALYRGKRDGRDTTVSA